MIRNVRTDESRDRPAEAEAEDIHQDVERERLLEVHRVGDAPTLFQKKKRFETSSSCREISMKFS